jgi:hypothetical protein
MTVVSEQGCDLRVGNENDVSAVSACATVGSSKRLELLAADRNTAVTAVSCTQVKRDVVYECGHVFASFARVSNA